MTLLPRACRCSEKISAARSVPEHTRMHLARRDRGSISGALVTLRKPVRSDPVALSLHSTLRGIEVDIEVTDVTVRLGWKLDPDDSWDRLAATNRARSDADKSLVLHRAKAGQRWLVQIAGDVPHATRLEAAKGPAGPRAAGGR